MMKRLNPLDIRKLRREFDGVATALGIVKADDWYHLTVREIGRKGFRSILKPFQSSLVSALASVYPEFEWLPWKFVSAPRDFWNNIENHKKYFNWISEVLQIQKPEDWYQVHAKDLIYGRTLLDLHYGGSFSKALIRLYPEYNLIPWKFIRTSKGYFDTLENQRNYLESLRKELNIVELDDWYRITPSDVIERGGAGLLLKYGAHVDDAFYKMLKTVYSNHKWHFWNFAQVPKGYWDNEHFQRDYFEWLKEQLNINEADDWCSITFADINSLNGGGLVRKCGGLMSMLQKFYPHHEWNTSQFQNKTHLHLLKNLRSICNDTSKLKPVERTSIETSIQVQTDQSSSSQLSCDR